jgi:hypothetical protein
MNFVKWFGHAHRLGMMVIDGMPHELVKVSEDETTSAIRCGSIYRINGVSYEARPRQNRKEGK